MTDLQERPAPESPDQLLAELRWIDGQLDGLFARRAGVVNRLQALHRSAPLSSTVPRAAGDGGSVQQLLLTTGAVLVGLAGMFFAAVAWALVGATGRLAILLVLGAVVGAAASWARPRLGGAAGALAAVSATLVATAGYAAPALWGVDWSATGVAAYAALVSAALAAAYAATAVVTTIRAWGAAATVTAAVGVVAAGLTAALAVEDALAYTAATAALVLVLAAVRAWIREPAAWWVLLVVAGGSSLASLLAWTVEVDRATPYAVALLGWAGVVLVVRRLAPAQVSATVALPAAAGLAAGAVALVVGTLGLGTPSLPLAGLAALLLVAVAHVRAVPVTLGLTAATVLAVGSVLVPGVDAAPTGTAGWTAWFVLVAVTAAIGGVSPRLGRDAAPRGLLWAASGLAACAAWLVHLGDAALDGPVERLALVLGGLLLLAGLGWAVSVRRTGAGWLPTVATLLPGLLVALLPGALSSLALSWEAGWSHALLRTLVYTGVGASLAVIGAQLRVAALLVAGEVVVAVCVLAHLVAATQVVPQWMVLAGTGAVLLAVGARWEWLRTRGTAAAGWVGRLR